MSVRLYVFSISFSHCVSLLCLCTLCDILPKCAVCCRKMCSFTSTSPPNSIRRLHFFYFVCVFECILQPKKNQIKKSYRWKSFRLSANNLRVKTTVKLVFAWILDFFFSIFQRVYQMYRFISCETSKFVFLFECNDNCMKSSKKKMVKSKCLPIAKYTSIDSWFLNQLQ